MEETLRIVFIRNYMKKKFKLKPEQIKKIIDPMGYCMATDMITVEGKKVGYMYREQPEKEEDSGWKFFSGSESQEYVDDPNNTMMYDVNTICNYDNDIVAHLEAPIGSEFERNSEGKLIQLK